MERRCERQQRSANKMTERIELPAASLSRFSRFLMEIHEMRFTGHALPQISMAKQKSSISLSNSPLKIPGKLERADVRSNFQLYPAVSTGRFLRWKELQGQEEIAFPFIGSSRPFLTSCDRAYTHWPILEKASWPAALRWFTGKTLRRKVYGSVQNIPSGGADSCRSTFLAGRGRAYTHSLIRTLYKVIPSLFLAAVFRASIYNYQPCNRRQ